MVRCVYVVHPPVYGCTVFASATVPFSRKKVLKMNNHGRAIEGKAWEKTGGRVWGGVSVRPTQENFLCHIMPFWRVLAEKSTGTAYVLILQKFCHFCITLPNRKEQKYGLDMLSQRYLEERYQ